MRCTTAREIRSTLRPLRLLGQDVTGADLGHCDLDALVAADFDRPDNERGVGQDGGAQMIVISAR